MHRFYTAQLNAKSGSIEITDQAEVHHIRDVLRLHSGDKVELFDGKGLLAAGTIASVSPATVRVTVERISTEAPRMPRLTLACAIPKKGKFENIIEKATELGVDEIIPLQTQNSDVVIKADKIAHKQQRYWQVAVNAAKQCHRAIIPVIHPPTSFTDALEALLKNGTVMIPSLTGDCRPILGTLASLPAIANLAIMIGPEGDFSPAEYAQAHGQGCLPVTLGSTVLKVETAAIASVALTRMYGDFKDISE